MKLYLILNHNVCEDGAGVSAEVFQDKKKAKQRFKEICKEQKCTAKTDGFEYFKATDRCEIYNPDDFRDFNVYELVETEVEIYV